MLFTKKVLEDKEAHLLAPYAQKSKNSAGRIFKEKEDQYRLCFQKDKERIIHCRAFRRLDEKTQVLIAGSGDHYRTRLTHTLEVAQIARGICRILGLNEDLAEAIALAHDLGHPPFGHTGEEVLNEIMKTYGKHFEHNEQSKRIVELLEKTHPEFDGLNLTKEVLEGLMKHQTAWDQAGKKFKIWPHLEAQAVNLADEIAYTNHDIDDSLRARLIQIKDLQKLELWKKAEKEVLKKYGKNLKSRVLISRTISKIVSLMILDICSQTEKNLKKSKKPLVCFSDSMTKMVAQLRRFLFKKFYLSRLVLKKVNEGKRMIKKLFTFYMKHPNEFKKEKYLRGEGLEVAVKDYIAGMTDGFLISENKRIFGKSKI